MNKKYKYTMTSAGTRNGLLLYRFWGHGPYPYYRGSIQCRTVEEAREAFKRWIPEEGITVRTMEAK